MKIEEHETCMEDKIYVSVRAMYGYGEEGDEIIDWLMENLK